MYIDWSRSKIQKLLTCLKSWHVWISEIKSKRTVHTNLLYEKGTGREGLLCIRSDSTNIKAYLEVREVVEWVAWNWDQPWHRGLWRRQKHRYPEPFKKYKIYFLLKSTDWSFRQKRQRANFLMSKVTNNFWNLFLWTIVKILNIAEKQPVQLS